MKLYRHTNIIISAIPYRNNDPKMNHHIRKLNDKMRIVINKYSHVKFVSLLNFLRSDYIRYGLHLNLTGKQRLACLIKDCTIQDIHFNNIENNMIPVKISQRKHFLGNRNRRLIKKT